MCECVCQQNDYVELLCFLRVGLCASLCHDQLVTPVMSVGGRQSGRENMIGNSWLAITQHILYAVVRAAKRNGEWCACVCVVFFGDNDWMVMNGFI